MTAPDVDALVTKMESALNVRDGVTFRWVTVNAADLRALLAALREARADGDRYRATLELIATADYRGNRSQESTVAFHALRAARAATGDPK